MKEPPQKILNILIRDINSGELNKALVKTKSHLSQNPHSSILYNILGLILHLKGDIDHSLDAYKKAIEIKPDFEEAHVNLGILYRDLGQSEKAIAVYEKAIHFKPNFPEAYNNLGNIYLDLADMKKARACYKRAIELNPNFAKAYLNLGNTCYEMTQMEEALSAYEKTIQLNPNSVQAHMKRGFTLHYLGLTEQAIASYKKAIQLNPMSAEAYNSCGAAFQDLRQLEYAIKYYEKAIQLKPDFAEAYNNISICYEETNDLEKADIFNQKALAISPENPNVNQTRAAILRRKGEMDTAIELLKQFINGRTTNKEELSLIHFELGRLYDRQKNAPIAYHHFTTGNLLKLAGRKHIYEQKKVFLSQLKAISQNFTQYGIELQPKTVGKKDAPAYFIVGFPRSGTTLLDQILDSHSNIQVMEEKAVLQTVIEEVPGHYPFSIAHFRESDHRRLSERYLELIDLYISRKPDTILIDKFPLNIIHVPLITKLFPNHRIILSLRHPCDVIISNFMQNYRLNPAMANFLKIEDTVTAYVNVMALWEKCISLLPVNFHIVKYESLVEKFHAEIAQLLEYLDMPWEDSVLEFYQHAKQRGAINTPSYHSVAEPIYRRAKFRWKRYEDQLSPFFSRLEPYVNAFGYSF